METRPCNWCAKAVTGENYFCSEKCRYEYNTAKDEKMPMYHRSYQYQESVAGGGVLDTFLSNTFFIVMGIFWLGVIDFLVYWGIKFFALSTLWGFIDYSPRIDKYAPVVTVVLLDLIVIGSAYIPSLLSKRG